MLFSCFSGCRGHNVDSEDLIESNTDPAIVWKQLEIEERRVQQDEQRERAEARRQTSEAQTLRRAEDVARLQAQDLARQVKDAQKHFKDEQARYEKLKRERELAEHDAAARQVESKRLLEERERWLRKMAVMAFLKENGFAGVNAPKRSMMKTIYPLHLASEAGDSKIVEMLLKEGADPEMRNSSGKTPAQVAQSKNHDVYRVLAGSREARVGGA